MDQEEMQEREKAEQQKQNKESPVWFVISKEHEKPRRIDQNNHIISMHIINLLFHFLTPQNTHHHTLCQF